MSIITLYAGDSSTLTEANKLPSPTGIKVSNEQIWSENTGRAQSGDNQAKMIGDSLAAKHTYAIDWTILTHDEFIKVRDLLPRGFFYFGIGTPSDPPDSPNKYYRSEISYQMTQIGSARYYRNVNVTVIEQ